MLAMIISIIVGLSILLSAFSAFTPGLQRLMESDFMRRANSNMFLYAMQKGQLADRAGTLTNTTNVTLNEDLRKRGNTTQDHFDVDIGLNPADNSRFITNITHLAD